MCSRVTCATSWGIPVGGELAGALAVGLDGSRTQVLGPEVSGKALDVHGDIAGRAAV